MGLGSIVIFLASFSVVGAAAAPPCAEGDPLCAALPPPQPKTRPTPKAKPKSKAKAKAGSRFGFEDHEGETTPAVAPSPAPKSDPEPEPEPESKSKNSTSQNDYRFEDDRVDGDALTSMDVLLENGRTPYSCLDLYMKPVENDASLDVIKAGFREAYRCAEPCTSEKDLDFLMSCTNWENWYGDFKRDPEKSTNPAYAGCSAAQYRDGLASGKYEGSRRDSDGVCRSMVRVSTQEVKAIDTDLILLIDNSSSMDRFSRMSVPLIAKKVLEQVQALNLNTRILLMSQNLGEAPVVLDASDPELLSKTSAFIKRIYSGDYPTDYIERPMLALSKGLPGVVRPEANHAILILSDENDSSPEEASEYIARLKKLSPKKWVVHTTSLDAAPAEPLTAPSLDSPYCEFFGIVSYAEERRESRYRLLEKPCLEFMSQFELDRKRSEEAARQDCASSKNQRCMVDWLDHSAKNRRRNLLRKESEWRNRPEMLELFKAVEHDVAGGAADVTGGFKMHMSAGEIAGKIPIVLDLEQIPFKTEAIADPGTLVVWFNGRRLSPDQYEVSRKDRTIRFKFPFDRSKAHELRAKYLVDPDKRPAPPRPQLGAVLKQLKSGGLDAAGLASCLTGKEMADLFALRAAKDLADVIDYLGPLTDVQFDEFVRSVKPEAIRRFGTPTSVEPNSAQEHLAQGLSLAREFSVTRGACWGLAARREKAEQWETRTPELGGGPGSSAEVLGRLGNSLRAMSFRALVECRTKGRL